MQVYVHSDMFVCVFCASVWAWESNWVSNLGGALLHTAGAGVDRTAGCGEVSLDEATPDTRALAEEPQEAPPELLTHKHIEHRVEAAVGESNGLCPLHGQREMMHLVAIQEVPLSLQHVEKDDNVVGGPEEEKGDDNDKDELDGFVLPLGLHVDEGGDDP